MQNINVSEHISTWGFWFWCIPFRYKKYTEVRQKGDKMDLNLKDFLRKNSKSVVCIQRKGDIGKMIKYTADMCFPYNTRCFYLMQFSIIWFNFLNFYFKRTISLILLKRNVILKIYLISVRLPCIHNSIYRDPKLLPYIRNFQRLLNFIHLVSYHLSL